MTYVIVKRSKEAAEKERRALHETAKQINSSKASAREFLIKGGFIKPDGQLHENYR